jgi:hypothetical protein
MQVEHKIQSGVGPMAMELAQVPKMLMLLRHIWAPEAFCVSFKVCVCNLQVKSLAQRGTETGLF